MKRVAILGSTGSIGTQTIEVIKKHPDKLSVVALASHSSVEKILPQTNEFPEAKLAMFETESAKQLTERTQRKVFCGVEGLIELATDVDVDIVVVCVAGMIGLQPISALQANKKVAIASKEVLVAGGAIVMPIANQKTHSLSPIDSEHSAILQCLNGVHKNTSGYNFEHIEKIILTASGGPFCGWTLDKLQNVTVEQALNHPTWKMGGKITIDSATLMNKGLEIIEACWLYDTPPENIEVVIHPQSVIHSIIKFHDGSALAQMGHPDMKVPIQYALLDHERLLSPAKNWDPIHTPHLTFENYDENVFISPNIAREAFRRGGVVPAYLNATNEMAANAFLKNQITFLDIQNLCEQSLHYAPNLEPTLENILLADKEARYRFQKDVTAKT